MLRISFKLNDSLVKKKPLLLSLGTLFLLTLFGLWLTNSARRRTVLQERAQTQAENWVNLLGRVVDKNSQFGYCSNQYKIYGTSNCNLDPECFGPPGYAITWSQAGRSGRILSDNCDSSGPRYTNDGVSVDEKPLGISTGIETEITVEVNDPNVKLTSWALEVTDAGHNYPTPKISESGQFSTPGPKQTFLLHLYRVNSPSNAVHFLWNLLGFSADPIPTNTPTLTPTPTPTNTPTPTSTPTNTPTPTPSIPRDDYADGQIIVRFKTSTPILLPIGAPTTRVIKNLDFLNLFVIGVPSGEEEKFVEEYNKLTGSVVYAELNYKIRPQEELPPEPNDAEFPNQWGLKQIHWAEAWNLVKDSLKEGIKIAILDTGTNVIHSDLREKIIGKKNFTSSPADEKVGDILAGHGTHVAGIAGAVTNNTLGIAGAGFNSSLLAVKVMGENDGLYSWTIEGIKWAINNGAKVINLSLSSPYTSRALEDAVNFAWKKGVVLVCAAGNKEPSASTYHSYPAFIENCIAVAASDKYDVKADFSNFGPDWVDVAAPGTEIYSTKDSGYSEKSGTSMAAPFVSGLAGILFAENPVLSNVQVRQIIEDTADHETAEKTGSKWGRINAFKAVARTKPLPIQKMTPGVQNCDYVAPTGTDQNQACRKCILETGGSWTVMGCLPNSPVEFVTIFLKFSLGIGGGVAFLAVVYGSFLLLTSAGNPQKINEGKKTVTYAIIGLLVIIFSVFILEFLGVKVLGLP